LWHLALHEKGGKRHEVPCHYSLDEYLDAWIAGAGIGDDKKGPLFRSFKKGDKLTGNPMIRSDVLYMIKRRAKGAALPLYLKCRDDLSESGCGRPPLPQVFKTVSSDWVATLGHNAKARTVAWDQEPASRKDGLQRWNN